MLALSRFVQRHKLAVAVFWLAVLSAGAVASAKLSGRLSAQFALPGAASYQPGGSGRAGPGVRGGRAPAWAARHWLGQHGGPRVCGQRRADQLRPGVHPVRAWK